jgi:hypothetical protein
MLPTLALCFMENLFLFLFFHVIPAWYHEKMKLKKIKIDEVFSQDKALGQGPYHNWVHAQLPPLIYPYSSKACSLRLYRALNLM